MKKSHFKKYITIGFLAIFSFLSLYVAAKEASKAYTAFQQEVIVAAVSDSAANKVAEKLSAILKQFVPVPALVPTQKLGGASGGFFINSCSTSDSAGGATTTLTYMNTNDTASTTLSCVADSADITMVNVNVRASSTARLQWEQQYSYNNIDWFGEDVSVNTATSTLGQQIALHATSTFIHILPVSINATTSRTLLINNLGAKYLRLRFFMLDANAAFWAQFMKRDLRR